MPPRASTAARQRGMALLAVLWLTALAGGIAFMIATQMRLDSEAAMVRSEQLRGRHLAVGGVYHALAQMLTAMRVLDQEDYWKADGAEHVVPFATGEAVVRVEDEGEKINVNRASFVQLEACFEHFGQQEAGELVIQALEERGVEASSEARGDEEAAAFVSLDQLLAIEGLTQKMFFGDIGVTARTSRAVVTVDEDEEQAATPLVSMLTVHGQSAVCPPLSQTSDEGRGRRTRQPEAEQQRPEGLPEQGEQIPEGAEETAQEQELPEGAQDEEESEQGDFQVDGVYSVYSTGRSGVGAAPVTVWLVVRLSGSSDAGYEVLYSRFF